MPNNITNIFTVSGSPEEIERFRVTVSNENPEVINLIVAKAKQNIERYEKTEDKNDPGFGCQESYKVSKEIVEKNKIPGCIFTFEGTVPMPVELDGSVSGSIVPEWQKKNSQDLINKYGADNWYDFNMAHYGTKWDAYYVQDLVYNDEGSITYRFNTAWSFPAIWIDTTAKLFPSLTFINSWHNEGGGSGKYTICVSEGIEEFEDILDFDWKLKYNKAFKEEYELITNGDYKEVIDQYYEEEYLVHYDLKPVLLNRIKDEDLPLFLDYNWGSNYKKKFKERIMNAHTPI